MLSLYYKTVIFSGLCQIVIAREFVTKFPLSGKQSVKYGNPPCSNSVFCHGRLLHTVQLSGIFKDSKTFVDMSMKNPENETLISFDRFMYHNNNNPSRDSLKLWIGQNFDKPGSEFENWIPTDWKEEPKFLENIKDLNYRKWISDLNGLWHQLGRKISENVTNHPDLYSIIPVKNPVIVPGGRFREFYYWDSYWIVKGLLLCEMQKTTKGMIENFLDIVNRYGFVPNGGRIYYLNRSQPPFLAAMVKEYVRFTNDTQFGIDAVAILDKEFQYWIKYHQVNVQGHKLFHYQSTAMGPRPESYKEDFSEAQEFENDTDKEEFYSHIKAAAESGMDFTSRWFIAENTSNIGTLHNLKTTYIVPVDLNIMLYQCANIIAELYALAGNPTKQNEFLTAASDIHQAVQQVMWNDTAGCWFDYDMLNNKSRVYYSATNLSPLWVGCYNKNDSTLVDKILMYIENNNLDGYPGGVPHTFQPTGEQWDFPNVWPPLQDILIKGLENLNDSRTNALAFKWADRWVRSNYLAYNETQAMYEKYDATELGGHGGGGEYEIQMGFGWSNGIVMQLLDQYGDKITSGSSTLNLLSSTLILAVLIQNLIKFAIE